MAKFRGRVFERRPNGGIGKLVSKTTITFTHEITRESKQVKSDHQGSYQIDLEPARYRVQAEHPDYKPYRSDAGFFVLRKDNTTANFFLHPTKITIEPKTSAFSGRVHERLSDGSIGKAVAGAIITFLAEGTSAAQTVTTNATGTYTITLPLGRYVVTASKQGYEPFSSEPGFFVLRPQPTTANIFLDASIPMQASSQFTFRGDRNYNKRTTL